MPHEHGQHNNVLKHFVYVWCGWRKQLELAVSLNHDVMTSFWLHKWPRTLKYELALRVRAYPWILSKYFSVCLCVSFVHLQIILGTVFRLIICILFAKLHRMSYNISLTCWILCNPIVFPFMLLFYIHFILIPTYKLYTDSFVQIWILFEIILSPGSAFFKYFAFFLHCSLCVGFELKRWVEWFVHVYVQQGIALTMCAHVRVQHIPNSLTLVTGLQSAMMTQ